MNYTDQHNQVQEWHKKLPLPIRGSIEEFREEWKEAMKENGPIIYKSTKGLIPTIRLLTDNELNPPLMDDATFEHWKEALFGYPPPMLNEPKRIVPKLNL